MEGTRLIAGAMSGTSADGVDVALVEVTGRGRGMTARLVHHHSAAYDPKLRERIFAVRSRGTTTLAELAGLGREISLAYAGAVRAAMAAAGVERDTLAAIAAHGQTLYQAPPSTIQWFDPALLAAEVGCAVVSDFRRADCAAGGQGAPLVPFADYLLFRHPEKHRVLLNLGGIANLTYVPPGDGFDQLIAFDTGPANCISDWLMRELFPESGGVDANGALAAAGKADENLACKVLSAPYFKQPPPKSTDAPAMIDLFFEAVGDLGGRSQLPRLAATACLITAASVVRAIRDFLPHLPDELVVSGGGVHNRIMMKALADQLHSVPLVTTDRLGVPSAAKEAIAFALLAAATLDGEPSNVPSVTGATRAVVLGSITPKP
jgi:anhydro-N-acetylmuramic acid kinase